jgi:hypothetical protein
MKMLNHFPVKGGISTQYSPKTIMSAKRSTINNVCCHLEHIARSTKKMGNATALLHKHKEQFHLVHHQTEKAAKCFFPCKRSCYLTSLLYCPPNADNVITRVNELAAGQPELLTFADRDGNKIGDALEDTPLATPHEIPGVIGDAGMIPGVDITEIKETEIEHANKETDHNDMPITPAATVPTTDKQPDEPPLFKPMVDNDPIVSIVPTPIKAKKVSTTKTVPAEGMWKSSWARQTPKMVVPSMKGKSYEYSAAQLEDTTHDPRVEELILTQLTLKAAIKMWGNKAKIAAESEMKQLQWRNTFKPI